MGKLVGSLWVLLFGLMMFGTQEVAAQTFLSRLFSKGSAGTHHQHKTIRFKRNKCGAMEAYNKQRAYKKHTPGRLKRLFTKRTIKQAERNPVAQTKKPSKLTPSPPTSTTSTGQPEKSRQNPPQQNSPAKSPVPDTAPPAPVAEKSPPPLEKPAPVPVEKKDDPLLTRQSLKKMTLKERRDTLRQMEPELVLEPLQFLSDQDEFSVVNMDSFMKAMEYAQQGKVVLVEGHTDDLGRERYNLDLSMKRAEKIRELLLSGGVSDELISVIGYGESQPRVPNTSTENRAINRRIEFKIFSLPE